MTNLASFEEVGPDSATAVSTDWLNDDCSFVASSPAMRNVRKQVMQIADVDVPVLLLGESGTGKEVIARLIHKFSSRAQQTFMKVNCAALPAELLESELFGHEAGAFTGATRAKPGKFEVCHRGTLLLDEIAEMPVVTQAKHIRSTLIATHTTVSHPTAGCRPLKSAI